MPDLKYVSFSLVLALMSRLQGKVFLFSFNSFPQPYPRVLQIPSVEIPLIAFTILHTVFKLLFLCFLQDVSEGVPKINDPNFLPFCRADFVLINSAIWRICSYADSLCCHSHYTNPYQPLSEIGCRHLQEGGQNTIQRHLFIRMSKPPDVRGYISSHAKQENLYAVYETTDRHYWTELAKCSQQEFQRSGTEGKCIETRKFIIILPKSFSNLYEPDKLLQLFTDRFKGKVWCGVRIGSLSI